MPFWDNDYDQIPMDDVAGVELYGDELIGPVVALGVLPTFASFGQVGQAVRGCGSIEIWTR